MRVKLVTHTEWMSLSPDEKWIAIIAGLRPARSRTSDARARLRTPARPT